MSWTDEQASVLDGRFTFAQNILAEWSSVAAGWFAAGGGDETEKVAAGSAVRTRSLPAKPRSGADRPRRASLHSLPEPEREEEPQICESPEPTFSQRCVISQSWDYPMSRGEKLLRLQCANEQIQHLMDMEVRQAKAEVVRLRRSSISSVTEAWAENDAGHRGRRGSGDSSEFVRQADEDGLSDSENFHDEGLAQDLPPDYIEGEGNQSYWQPVSNMLGSTSLEDIWRWGSDSASRMSSSRGFVGWKSRRYSDGQDVRHARRQAHFS
mmetsp:Transcript_30051/g.54789  ORF Transcript_30051/g.54789 Transcript_30051/m.54789 type:complete len:267 (+) Transcript_30051:97-897(+)